MTIFEMQSLVNDFLKQYYPGSKESPTGFATLLISDEPEKIIRNKAVLMPAIEEKECIDKNNDILNDLNMELNTVSCPPEYIMVDRRKCVIAIETEMAYENASHHCSDRMGGEVLALNSYHDLKALENILGNELFVIHISRK